MFKSQLLLLIRKTKIINSADYLATIVNDKQTYNNIGEILDAGYVIQDGGKEEFNYFIDLNKEIIYLENEDSSWIFHLTPKCLQKGIIQTELQIYQIGQLIKFKNKNNIEKQGYITKIDRNYFIYQDIETNQKYRAIYKNIKKLWVENTKIF